MKRVITEVSGLINVSRGLMMPCSITWSRSSGPSPAMLPRAQTACSATTGWGEPSRAMNPATAPALTTALVCSDVPEAMLVRAQADSNCKSGLYKIKVRTVLYKHGKDSYFETRLRNSTSLGTTFALMRMSMGGLRSLLSILRAAWVAVISLFSSPLLIPVKRN